MASPASQSATSQIFLPVEGSKTSTRFLAEASTHLPPIHRSVGMAKGAGPLAGVGVVSVLVMVLSSSGISGGKRGAVAGKGGAGDRLEGVHIQLAGIVVDQAGGADGGFRGPVLLVFRQAQFAQGDGNADVLEQLGHFVDQLVGQFLVRAGQADGAANL